MSLKHLIELSRNIAPLDLSDPLVQQRLEESYKRVAEFDKGCDARIKARKLTTTQLNKIIDL